MSNLEQYADEQDIDAQAQEPTDETAYEPAELAPDTRLPELKLQAQESDSEYADESEEQELSSAYADDSETPAQDGVTPQAPELDTLAHLPLDLILRCGIITLTLGELRQLNSGTVLDVAGVTPGFATLCHGERIVAEGELVDVDGRLGLQITRMASLS